MQELTTKLSDEGVVDSWFEELRAQGLSEEEVIAEVHEMFVNEYEAVNGHYEPPGLYVMPGDDGTGIETGEETGGETEGEQVEVIGIGRIEVIETIDAETGEVKKEIVGWYDGALVENVKEGGGYALGVPYKDPATGNVYTFDDSGYSVETQAGVVHSVDYPEGYTPSSEYNYNYGDEAFTFMTETGDEVVYSATGYEFKDSETDKAIVEEAYTQEAVTFVDGSSLDNEPTGYVFNDNDDEAIVYAYNPEFGTYQDVVNGKVYIPPTLSSHLENTIYDSETGVYKYNYGGVEWSSSGDGNWKSETGQQVGFSTVPAPVGYEQAGIYTTPTGKQWVYDSNANKWTETTTKNEYYVAPNNEFRYDEEGGRYVDTRGNWFDSNSANYNGLWNYDTTSGVWVSSETGDTYDSSTGTITHPDGTTFVESGESEGGPPCYGCYYQGGEGDPGTYTYSGGYYINAPGGGYVYHDSGSGGDNPAGKTFTDSTGQTYTYNGNGVWTAPDGSTVATYSGGGGYYSGEGYSGGSYSGGSEGSSSGSYYSGGYAGGPGSSYPGSSSAGGGAYGGGYTDKGVYVGGSYGAYDSAGNLVGTGDGGTSGGDSGGSTSGGDSGGSTGGDSGGSTGGDSGGSTGDSGSSGSGYAVKDTSSTNGAFSKLFGWFKGLFRR